MARCICLNKCRVTEKTLEDDAPRVRYQQHESQLESAELDVNGLVRLTNQTSLNNAELLHMNQ